MGVSITNVDVDLCFAKFYLCCLTEFYNFCHLLLILLLCI